MAQRRTFSSRGVRPAQVFKKRHNRYNTTVVTGSNATLLSEIVLRETGTIYSVKISAFTIAISAVAGDVGRLDLWVRCVPAATTLPDFTSAVVEDTVNGFFVGTIYGTDVIGGMHSLIDSVKFRFRRKCDENTLLQLIATSQISNGVGRSNIISGMMAAVIRVK